MNFWCKMNTLLVVVYSKLWFFAIATEVYLAHKFMFITVLEINHLRCGVGGVLNNS